MSVIFLLGAVQALFLEVILSQKKNKSLADKILALWILFIAAHLFLVYLQKAAIIFNYPHLLGIIIPFPMLHGPFLYFYIDSLTKKRPQFRTAYWWHLLPMLIVYGYLAAPFLFRSGDYKIYFVTEVLPNNPPFLVYFTQILYILSGVSYVTWSFLALKKHQKAIVNTFSYTDKINLNWMWYLLVSISIVWGFVVLTTFLEVFAGIDIPLSAGDYIFGALTIFVFMIGYFGIQQTHIFTNNNLRPTQETVVDPHAIVFPKKSSDPPSSPKTIVKRYEKSGLKEQDVLPIKTALLQLMEAEKLYLNPKLSLNQLAQKLDIHSNYLSQIINEHLGQNFYEFVNSYRVDLFKQKVLNPKQQNLTILAIAYECGFGSKSSFNNVFKKMEGITPSAYVKSTNPSH